MKLLAIADTASIERKESHVGAVTRLAKQLNMAFLVYRGLMSSELKKSAPTVTSKETADVVIEATTRVKDYWTANFSPNIKAGLKIGGLDDATASIMAGRYAGKLADQINEVSDRAFLEGYHAALNKKWDRALAWERISEAYGIDPVQMRKWVDYYPEEGYHPQDIPEKSRSMLDKMLGDRGTRIGDHESWSIKQIGKQTYWSQQVSNGNIPDTAKKVWYTARDELVCPVCASLDGIAIEITAEFDTGSGDFFVPPLHVNCRCEINLQFPDVVTKAMGKDAYNRDKKGRFSSAERRQNKSVGQWDFADDPKWNQQINADVDRITSESPYENQPEWLYQEQSAASHMYSKWLDSPSGPFSESYGDTTATSEVGGYIDWLTGQGEFRLKYPSTSTYKNAGVVLLSQIDIDHFDSMSSEDQKQWIRDMAPYSADKRSINRGVIEKNPNWKPLPAPHNDMWDRRPLKKLSDVPAKSLSKDEVEAMRKWNSPEYDDWNHADKSFEDYSRPSTVTRGSKSQPQKKSAGQSSVKRLIVKEPPKKKIPYGSEKITKISPSEKVALGKADLTAEKMTVAPAKAKKITAKANINRLENRNRYFAKKGITKSPKVAPTEAQVAEELASVIAEAEEVIAAVDEGTATQQDVAQVAEQLSLFAEEYVPSKALIYASGTGLEMHLAELDIGLDDGQVIDMSSDGPPGYELSTDGAAMLSIENDMFHDTVDGSGQTEYTRKLVVVAKGSPSLLDDYDGADVTGKFRLHLVAEMQPGDTWDNRATTDYSEWSQEGIDVGAVEEIDPQVWDDEGLQIYVAVPVDPDE